MAVSVGARSGAQGVWPSMVPFTSFRATAAAMMLLPAVAVAQFESRSFSVTPVPAKASVGDSIRLRFRLVLNERDLLTDTIPKPAGELPGGVRVHSVERLRRGADRVFTGEAVVAFYRPGVREIPAFGVPWVQIVSGRRGAIATEAATVEIVPVLPGGNPALRDIREPEPSPGPGPLPLLLALLGAAALGSYLRRRRRPAVDQVVEPVPDVAAPPAPPDPYGIALARLAEIERERWAERGDVERHYEAAADALRDYLETAEQIPARERTSSELVWALPPRLLEGGLRRLTAAVLGEADLVKFARSRPGPPAAATYLREARELLRRWHEAAREVPEEADAVR